MSTPEPTEPEPARSDERPSRTALAAEDGATAAAPDPAAEATEAAGSTGDAAEATAGDAEAAAPERTAGGAADLLPSPMFVLLLGVTGLAGWFSWTRAEVDWTGDATTVYLPFVFMLGGWIASLALHEFGHALAAHLSGDRTQRGGAYLRLNPFGYSGLFAGLLMPVAFLVLGGIGMTGPAAAHVDPRRVPGRGRRTLVALAGPAVSLVLAAAFAAVVAVLVPAGAVTDNWLIVGLMYLCYLNLTAALLNLLPIPGFDGFAALAPYLPERVAGVDRTWGLFGVIAVFGVLWLAPVNLAFLNAVLGLFAAVGLPQIDIGFGEILFRFWVT
jgi:Zn-dependent protease